MRLQHNRAKMNDGWLIKRWKHQPLPQLLPTFLLPQASADFPEPTRSKHKHVDVEETKTHKKVKKHTELYLPNRSEHKLLKIEDREKTLTISDIRYQFTNTTDTNDGREV